MGQSIVRFAAGAGLVAATLLIVGPYPAQAVADKNGSGSHSKYDGRKHGPPGHSNAKKRTVSDWVNDVFDVDGAGNGLTPDRDPPRMELGSSGNDLGELTVMNTMVAEGPVALRSAAVAEEPTGVNASGAAPKSSGSDYTGPSVSAFRSPRVVVGNGRTPGTRVPGGGSAPEAVFMHNSAAAPEAVPAPAPEAIVINLPPLPPPLPSIQKIRPADLVVGEFGTAKIDRMTDPLAGAAGLILIPAIGAVLGFRQARAAQSIRESTRT